MLDKLKKKEENKQEQSRRNKHTLSNSFFPLRLLNIIFDK